MQGVPGTPCLIRTGIIQGGLYSTPGEAVVPNARFHLLDTPGMLAY